MPEDRDREHEEEEEEEEEEEWLEPVEDLEELDDGNCTTFVGGCSAVHTVAAAVEQLRKPDDRIVILPGLYDGDLELDTTVRRKLEVLGDPQDSTAVTFKGSLTLTYSAPEDEDDDEPRRPIPPLKIGHMRFLGGAVFREQTDADVVACVFGEEEVPKGDDECPQRTVRCHGFSTVRVADSVVYGMARSAVYCFPRAMTHFSGTKIVGGYPKGLYDLPDNLTKRERRLLALKPPPTPPPVPKEACTCEVGIQCDDSNARFTQCNVTRFTIGLLTSDVCKNTVLEYCSIRNVFTVGALLGKTAAVTLRGCAVRHCGREVVVVGTSAHPTIRECVLGGDVRLQADAVMTGATDNVVSAGGAVTDESTTFAVKGFTATTAEPPSPRPPKPQEDDEEDL